MFEAGELTDIAIRIGRSCIHAHRVVLASASPFFKGTSFFFIPPYEKLINQYVAMFSSGMEESRQTEIEIESLDNNALELIISYMYTGTLNITGENVIALLDASNLLEMVDVVSACCCKLVSELCVSNCLHILECAERYQTRQECEKLFCAANAYVNNYFTQIRKTSEFLQLEKDRLINILHRDTLCTANEDIVYDAAQSWLAYDLQERIHYATEIFSCIRFPLLTSGIIEQLDSTNRAIAPTNDTDRIKILAADYSSNLPLTQVRKRRDGIPTIYAIGGCDGKRASRSMEVHDAVKNEWKTLSYMHEKRSYFGSAILNGKIYAVGGHNDSQHLRSVEVYDSRTNTWTELAPMSEVRSYLGVVTLNNRIYAIGGYDGDFHTNTVERFNPETLVWDKVAPLNVPRSGLAAAVVQGKIYVVGGFDGNRHLSSAERYDPETNQWVEIKDMLHVRNGPGAVQMDGSLYVIGGEFKHGKRIRSGEKYDPETDEWIETASMTECTSGHGIASLDNIFMFSVGGSNDENNYLRTAFRYDSLSKSWQALAPMKEMRCGLSVAVVDCIPDQDRSTLAA